jgi:hypothetical protein
MSRPDDPRDAELHDLLSALLDGELSAAETAEVRAYVERSPDAQADLDALARVRSWVRDLPEVDPPFGFYERMLSPRNRRYGSKAAAALVAAAAAIVVILGLTPVADTVVPPVNAYAERHMHMITPPEASPGPGTTSTTASGTGTSAAAPTTKVPAVNTGTVVQPPASAERANGSGSFNAVPPGDLDHLGAPEHVDSYKRMGGYQSDRGVLHVMYSNGDIEISIYEQPGTVAWESLPTSGTRMRVGDSDAWSMRSGTEEVMVVERGTTVYTAVAIGGHDEMMSVVQAMPPPPPPSMMDRARQACRSVVEQFGFDR